LAGSPKRRRRRPGRPRSGEVAVPFRLAILDAALEVFGRAGFDGARLADIAGRAGVTKPLVHYHFQSKAKLWEAAVQHGMRKLGEEFSSLAFELKGIEPRAALRVVLRRYTLFAARNRAVTNIIMQELARDTERARWASQTVLAPLFTVGELFLRNTNPTRFEDVAPAQLIATIIGAVNGYFAFSGFLAERFDVDILDEATVEKHAETVTDLVLSGLLVSPDD